MSRKAAMREKPKLLGIISGSFRKINPSTFLRGNKPRRKTINGALLQSATINSIHPRSKLRGIDVGEILGSSRVASSDLKRWDRDP